MTYYLILFFIILLLSLILKVRGEANYRNNLLVCIGLIFVFFAFRVGFTPDYYGYESYFEGSASLTRHEDTEFGFIFLVNLIPSYRVFIICQSLLLCVCFYVAFYYYISVDNWWIAFVVLFFASGFMLGNFSGARSSFVTVAFFVALLIKDRSKFSFAVALALLLAASTIHTSGLVMIPFLFLDNKQINQTESAIIIVLAVILCIISFFSANSLNILLNRTVDYLGFNDRFEDYKQDKIRDTMQIGAFTILRLMMLFFLLFETISMLKIDIGKKMAFVKLTSVFFLLTLMPGIGLISRFYYYFSIPVLIGATTVIDVEENKIRKLLYMACIVLYSIWDLYLLYQSFYFIETFALYENILF